MGKVATTPTIINLGLAVEGLWAGLEVKADHRTMNVDRLLGTSYIFIS